MKRVQLLTDVTVLPDDELISEGLGDSFATYILLMEKVLELGITVEWRYYNDGKAWLGKGLYHNKTIFWLSIWDGFFKISLYFTEKNRMGIELLPIDTEIKEMISNEPAKGKLIPLALDISSKDQLDDVITLISYKYDLR